MRPHPQPPLQPIATLASLLREQAQSRPDAPALLAPGREPLSYAQLHQQVQRLGGHLSATGVLPGTRVAVVLPNGPEMAAAFLGVAAHAACAPLNPTYLAAELRFHLQDTRAEAVLMRAGEAGPVRAMAAELGLTIIEIHIDAAAPAGCFTWAGSVAAPASSLTPCQPDDTALLLHTSGTTAGPKLVPLSHANLLASAHNIAAHLALTEQDRCLNVMPLFHIHGLVGVLLASLAGGASVVCTPGFDELGFFDWIKAFDPSWYSAVPTIHQAVLAHGAAYREKAPAHRFRFVRSSSAALPAATLRQLATLLQTPVVEAYGMTEASHQMASNAVQRGEQTAGSVGVAAGVEIGVRGPLGELIAQGEPGEICIRGAGVTRGYENNPKANAEAFRDGWFRTGDLGHLDAQGRLFIAGRLKEIVNRGGEKIAPREVDDALLEHPDVAQAATFGVPHPTLGEDLAAAVVRRAGSGVDEPALRTFLLARLAAFKVPSQIVLVQHIPAGATGKVQRASLHQALAGALTRAFVAPGTGLERAVEAIFREVLGCAPLGLHDNFFASGGDSLRGARVMARVNARFGLRLPVVALFEHPNVAELVAHMQACAPQGADVHAAPPVLARQHGDRTSCSSSQEALWVVERLLGGTGVYNTTQAVRITGALDVPALGQALQALLQRHEILRTCFDEVDGVPVQRVQANAVAPMTLMSAHGPGRSSGTGTDTGTDESEFQSRLREEAQRPFDLARAPLLRASLWPLGDGGAEPGHVLLLVLHHIVADGWSMQVIAHDLGALYSAFSHVRAPTLPVLPIQFADWALWQRGQLHRPRLAAALQYWRGQLAGLAPLALPTDLPRPAQLSYAGRTERFTVEAELLARLNALAREQGVTLFMLLLAAFKVLLMRYSGQCDVAVGSPVAGRGRPELEGMVGYFVNSVVLRTDLSGNPSFTELLGRVRQTALEAYTHQELPFDQLVAELSPQRDLSRNPLYQVSFALNNQPATVYALEGVSAVRMPLPTGTAKFDLSLSFAEENGGLQGMVEYSTDLFEPATAQRLVSHVLNLLAGVAADAGQRITRLPLMAAAERQQMLVDWNHTARQFPSAAAVHTLIEQQALRTPDAPALLFGAQCLNYRELNTQANRLAHRLRRQGVGPEVLVAVCMERSARMVVALLAVLKAGGALVPMDPELPPERLAFMLQDTQAPLLLTHSSLLPRFVQPGAAPAPTVWCLDTPWPQPGHGRDEQGPDEHDLDNNLPTLTEPAHLAYLIYTSGSTGRPKGVMLEHRGWSNHVRWMQQTLRVTPADRFLQITSISFDAAMVELFMPLQAGAALVLAEPGEHRDSAYLARCVRSQSISVIQMVPSALRSLLAEPQFDGTSLRYVISGGEALDGGLAHELQQRLPQVTLGNFYGPTEASIDATQYEVPRPPASARAVPAGHTMTIGRPIANTQCFVLDAALQPVPVGVTGELLLGGIGLARGYLNRPELTTERFIAHPFAAGERLYRTGDLARYRADGNIEYLGRSDLQVKIRGHRIELGEIEAVLNGLPGVREAVVIAREDAPGAARLLAYITTHTSAPADPRAELKRQLAARLPDYMLPSALVLLPVLPTLANGKLDRNALPVPDAPVGDGPPVPPRTPAEQLVWGLWRDVLGLEQFGVHDSFFDLGGQSLLATRLMARLREALQVDLPLRVLFESPTIAALVQRAQQALPPGGHKAGSLHSAAGAPAPIPRLGAEQRRGLLPLSAAQQRMAFWHDINTGTPLYNLPLVLDLQGPLDVPLLQGCLHTLAHRHEVLRTRWVDAHGQRWQQIDEHGGWPLRQMAPAEACADTPTAEACEQATAHETLQDFDLGADAPMRALLIPRGPLQHRLVLTLHHSVCDGVSASVLLDELSTLYTRRSQGQPDALAEPALQYTDYAAWEPEWLAHDVRPHEAGYWRQHLADAPASVDLPTDHPRPARQRHQGAAVGLALSAAQSAALQALAQHTGSTLFMVVLALWQTLLHRYSGQATVVTGTVSANRGRRELESVVGCFANTLALRCDFNDGITVAGLLAQAKANAVAAFEHQQLPFDEVVAELKLARDGSRMPLVQTFVVLQPAEAAEHRFGTLLARRVGLPSTVAKFDVSLELQMNGGVLAGCIEYDTALFERETVLRMAGHLRTLTDAMCANPSQPVAGLALLGETERRLVLLDWNRTEQAYPLHIGVHTMVEQQAERTPQASAVVFGDTHLSYAELNTRANRLAHHLRHLGVAPDVLVGVCMERSLPLAVALLAVLKAGGAFVPLDPELPAARLTQLLGDTAAPVLLTQAHLRARLPATAAPAAGTRLPHLLCLDTPDPELAHALAKAGGHNPTRLAGPDSLAYVIFTSGSTGRPKGVMSLHRGLTNHIVWLEQALAVTAADRLLQKTTISFDAAVWEFFTPWRSGATLVLARPGEHRDPQALVRTLREQAISIVQFVPSALRAVLDEPGLAACAALRYVVSGGEALDGELARTFHTRLPNATLGNFYGPSEASDDATHTVADAHHRGPGSVPIGRPIANVQCYVLDALLQPQPIGVAGELFVGGAGLARGYLGRADLTAERFIAHPFSAGARLYRTGDQARWRADGQLEFLGRNDFQVKIRGQRIELGEIEATLNAQAGVHQAVVVAREDPPGVMRLVAYVVGAAQVQPDPAALKQRLAALLPQSMVPSVLVVLPALPTLPNGKIDRKALPTPPSAHGPAARTAPRTPTEQAIWEIWRDVLGTGLFGVHDNFFDLGGQSLLAAQVMSRLRAALQIGLALQALFDAPTVAGLSLRADQAAHDTAGTSTPIAARGHDGPVPLSAVQRSMWLTERVQGQRAAYHMPATERLSGPLRRAALEQALAALVQRHDSLRLRITLQDGAPLQQLDDSAALPLEYIDLSALPAAPQGERLHSLLSHHAETPFELAQAPLARALLVKLADEEHVFQWVLHHLVSDGWSAQLLRDDLADLYRAFAAGTPAPAPSAGPGYLDYAAWEAQRIESGALAQHTHYWTERLRGLEPLNLPFVAGALAAEADAAALDAGDDGVATPPDPCLTLALPADEVAGLAALARRGNATLFMVYLAAFKLLLSRWCDQADIAVGTPIARRDRPELAQMVGPLLNTLVLRTELSGELSFEALLARVRDTALQAYLHQEQPFDTLVAALNPARIDGRNPLFDVMVNALPDTQGDAPLEGLACQPIELGAGAAKFAITLYIRSQPGSAEFTLHYRGALFAPGQMAALMAQYGHLLAQIAAQPQVPVASHSLITPQARALLPDPRLPLQRPGASAPAHSVFAAFLARAAERPDALAAASADGELSYAELEQRSRHLAEALVARGVVPGDRVALHADRCLGLVVGVLGAARAGAAFCILDSAYPDTRNQDCLAQLAPRIVLICGDHAWAGPDHDVPTLRVPAFPLDLPGAQEAPAAGMAVTLPTVAANAAAVVAFTSGTSGRPKGIVSAHAPLPHFVAWHVAQHGLVAQDRFSVFSGLAHDPLLRDLFTPLSIGAALCIPRAAVLQQPQALAAWLQAQRVTVAHLTPALGDVIAAGCGPAMHLDALRRVFWGGEMLAGRTVALLRGVAPQATQVNFYGTTETPQAMAHWAVPTGRAAHVQPVGRGIADSQLLLLRPGDAQAGIGESAEICVRSPYLALGYLDDPELTRARFVRNPFSADPEDRCYRTGDLGRYDSDGNVQVLGRIDDQINVRGLRVEPAEIERVAESLPGVARAVVRLVKDAGAEPATLLYYSLNDGADVSAAAVEARLRQALPSPMWPRGVINVPAFARLPNGKVDLRALPGATPVAAVQATAHNAPSGETECTIAEVWQELLGVPHLSRTDNFFDLGGHSLLALRAAFAIEQRCGLRLDLRRMVHESLAQLATSAPALAAEPELAHSDAAPQANPSLFRRLLKSVGLGRPGSPPF